jgi:hypothetical protein
VGTGLKEMRLFNRAGAGHLRQIIGPVALPGKRQAKPPQAWEAGGQSAAHSMIAGMISGFFPEKPNDFALTGVFLMFGRNNAGGSK